jgi:hypothetical protein
MSFLGELDETQTMIGDQKIKHEVIGRALDETKKNIQKKNLSSDDDIRKFVSKLSVFKGRMDLRGIVQKGSASRMKH